MTQNRINIGVLQSRIQWEDKDENFQKLVKQLEKVDYRHLDMVLLPEMSFTGFSMNTEITGEDEGETTEKIRELCRKYKISIGYGWVKNRNESENHYTIINKEGEQLADYIKIHPFSYSGENRYFIGGNHLTFFELNGIIFSTVICYDLRFPELFRLASQKADVIIVPANWPKKRIADWDCLLKARALENQVYIIGINCVGEMGRQEYNGHSCFIAPDGTVIDANEREELLIAHKIVNNVAEYRANFPVYADRKPAIYKKIESELFGI